MLILWFSSLLMRYTYHRYNLSTFTEYQQSTVLEVRLKCFQAYPFAAEECLQWCEYCGCGQRLLTAGDTLADNSYKAVPYSESDV